MTKPNLTVCVIGGVQSGKTELAELIAATLKRKKLYGVQLTDNGCASKPSDGPVKVSVETQLADDVLNEHIDFVGPEKLVVGLSDLKACFMQWVTAHRAGELQSVSVVGELPAGQVAEESAQHLFALLKLHQGI